MLKDTTVFVGLDVHKATIQVAMLIGQADKPVEWQVVNEPAAVKRMVLRIWREGGAEVRCCYEAGPCGYTLQRQLKRLGVSCTVVAPSLIPIKPGERIKTDRRDARKLARYFRDEELTEVHPPTEQEEAVRDLCRARQSLKEDLTRSRNRLTLMLLRRGVVYGATLRRWTEAHRRWLQNLRLEHQADQIVLEDSLLGLAQLEQRLTALVEQLEALALQQPYREAVGWLRCFRGIDTSTAMSILVELHGFRRFDSPRRLMAYLGLVPTEHSSGARVRRGGITKAGNAHARRVLVEAAWHYRHRPGVGPKLRARRVGQPGWAIGLADKAQHRLHKRYLKLTARGKHANKVIVSLARELAGFLWVALYRHEQEQAA